MLPTDGATRWAAGEEAMHSLEDERSRLIIGVGLKNSPIVKQLSKLPTRGSHREARVSLDISSGGSRILQKKRPDGVAVQDVLSRLD